MWPDTGAPAPTDDRASESIRGAIHLGPDRTESGDLAFGIRQLEDIAMRALSPAINDPTTAVHAIQQLSAILVPMAHHPLGVDKGYDEDGALRVTAPRGSFASYLELALGQVRRYGSTEPAVLIAVLRLLTDVAEHATDSVARSDEVRDQIERTRSAARLSDSRDIAQFEDAVAIAHQTLDLGRRPTEQDDVRE